MVVLDLDLLPPNAKFSNNGTTTFSNRNRRSTNSDNRGIPCYFVLDGTTQQYHTTNTTTITNTGHNPYPTSSSLTTVSVNLSSSVPSGGYSSGYGTIPQSCRKLKRNYLLVLRRRRDHRLRRLEAQETTIVTGFVKKRDSMLCCGRQKDQAREIPPNAEPAASPRRIQFGQLAAASTLPHPPHHQGVERGRELPPMVLQPDFRKVSGISSEIFKQLEAVENDHDATTAAALDAVERRGEMLVRMLDPRNQFSRSRQDLVRKFVSMQDGHHTVHFVEIVKRPGQTLGLYIREGNGFDRCDGVFISRIAIESAVFNSGCLGVGDEILAVNLIDVTHMSLDDVVIIMSIPRRLVLTIRQRKSRMGGIVGSGTGSMLRPDGTKPVVIMKKEVEDEAFEESTDENNHHMGHGPHSFPLSQHPIPPQGIGRGRMSTIPGIGMTPGQRLYASQQQSAYGPAGPIHPTTIQPSLPRYPTAYQHYANFSQIQINHGSSGTGSQLPDVTDYTPRIGLQDDYSSARFSTPQPPLRKPSYAEYYDGRPEPPPRPSTGQGGGGSSGFGGSQYDWYGTTDRHHHHHHPMDTSTGGGGVPLTHQISYQPPPPVITEQPRSINIPAHFQSFDRAYPKTLESLAEKVHTFYTGPRPIRQSGRSQMRMPRTGSDHRINLGRAATDGQPWYGSMPRQRPSLTTATTEYRATQIPLSSVQPRYSTGGGVGARLPGSLRRKPCTVLDYASDSEAMTYGPSLRSGLPLSASTRRSLGLSNGRSNSLPRDFIRGGSRGRKSGGTGGLRLDKHGLLGELSSNTLAGRRALLLAAASGLDSQDESDGAASAPEMPSSRRHRGESDYRGWIQRAPSTSAIYERLKTTRDLELIQTQRAAKFNYSAENLSILDRARQRTEREIKRLQEDIDRETHAQAQLSAWEASQAVVEPKEPPSYYSTYRTPTGLGGPTTIGGDSSALARVLARRSPSTSSALASLGIRDVLTTSSSFTKDSLSADTLTRLGLSTSRSRDLLSSGGDGRTTPTSVLLQRLTATTAELKDPESLSLRKEILNRSRLSRDYQFNRDSILKDSLLMDEKVGVDGISTSSGICRLASVGVSQGTVGSLLARSGSTGSSITTSTGGPIATTTDSRLKLLTINPSEFIRYKIERPSSATGTGGSSTGDGAPIHGHSGILRVHLLAGRALRSTVRTTDASVRTRDLYCVLECDRIHKARTVVCTGDQNFDWDETFELDLVNNKELDFLIYSWDPQLRHRLCYKGSVNLVQILNNETGILNSSTPGSLSSSPFHQLAIKVEPRGTLYVKLRHTIPQEAFRRELKKTGLFGADLGNVVMREDSGLNVPLIVQKCIEEIERRGLDIIGLYRLCGSAAKKQILRDAFERSPRSVDLSAENVPDINVIAGVLKDYLRELPEPLLTKCLYQMLVDALGVCLPDDPEGNARLLFSIIECLPKPNRCTLLMILEHLSLVCSLSDRNKMGPMHLATCFGPILMIYYDQSPDSLNFQPPIKVLQYLLEVWPAKSGSAVTMLQTVREAGVVAVRKGSILMGKGRAFPRSSPASVLLSKSQKMILSGSPPMPMIQPQYPNTTSNIPQLSPLTSLPHQQLQHQQHHNHHHHSLPLSLSKQSPGSHSESSPSPTTKHGSIQHPIMPSVVTSSSSGALTLTPSTTSSSLTSVTTPNSLTPVSSTAKSITPATTSSNYSLTSELSTTLMSPTPGKTGSESSPIPTAMLPVSTTGCNDIFTNVSVRSRASAFEVPTAQSMPQPLSLGQLLCQPQQQGQHTQLDNIPPRGSSGEVLERSSSLELQKTIHQEDKVKLPPPPPAGREITKAQPIPPSPFPIRRFTGPGPGHVERRHSIEERERRKLPTVPSQPPHPLIHQSSLPTILHQPKKCIGDMSPEKTNGHLTGSSPPQKQPPPPPPPKPKSKSGSVDSISGGSNSSAAPSPPSQSNSNGSASSSPSWATTIPAGGPSPVKISSENGQPQSPGTPAKVISPSPASTPPPVPPRLDRRPSQPSPTSSPPAMPPPVPPRLGRAAPVRTPSLDSREAFEVDCYTIKEENGEEDYLT